MEKSLDRNNNVYFYNWTDLAWNLKVDDECLPGISYFDEGGASADTSILVVDGFNDIFVVAGCIHTIWTGALGTKVKVGARVLSSTDDGSSWEEDRCLQSLIYAEKAADAQGTRNFNGTLKINNKTWLKLQVRVSNTNMELEGDDWFDNPVAATIRLQNMGNNAIVT